MTLVNKLFSVMDEGIVQASKNGHRIEAWAVVGYESASAVCEDCGATLTVVAASKEVSGQAIVTRCGKKETEEAEKAA